MANQPTMLIEDLHAYYGASHVLQGVNLSLSGAGVSLVGRNGMGKTTLVRTIMGLVPARGGSVRFKGREITRLRPHEIASLGIGYVPQGRRLFPSLSVLEHLILCARPGNGAGRGVEKVFAMFPRLADRAHSSGTALSGGEQQMLAIARALVTNPELLIMDEPSEGFGAGHSRSAHRRLPRARRLGRQLPAGGAEPANRCCIRRPASRDGLRADCRQGRWRAAYE